MKKRTTITTDDIIAVKNLMGKYSLSQNDAQKCYQKALTLLEIIWSKRNAYVHANKASPNIIVVESEGFECLKKYCEAAVTNFKPKSESMKFTDVRLISSNQLEPFEVLVH